MIGVSLLRPLLTFGGVILGWWALTLIPVAPSYILPSPGDVAGRMWTSRESLASNAVVTFGAALTGFVLGSAFGALNALTLVRSEGARRWLLPLLIGGQAVPVFALAPILTLWFGYGPTAKIVMTVLVVYFPVTASFYDGLRRCDPNLLDMARVMNATPTETLWRLRVPGALPALGSGLRLAAVFAPISAVIGEWTGGSAGLGYLMLYANARTQADLLFAALITLALMGVALHALVSHLTRRATRWAPESTL
ncbi:MAG: ABC transporter permease [Pseudomonadota bacterium]